MNVPGVGINEPMDTGLVIVRPVPVFHEYGGGRLRASHRMKHQPFNRDRPYQRP